MRKFIHCLPVLGLLWLSVAMGWNMSNVAVLGAAKPKAGGGGVGTPGFRSLLYADVVSTDVTDTRTFTNSAAAGEMVVALVKNASVYELATNIIDSAGNSWTRGPTMQSMYENHTVFYSLLANPLTGGSSTFTVQQSNVIYTATTVLMCAITNATSYDGWGTNWVSFDSSVTATNASTAASASVGCVSTEVAFPLAANSWGNTTQIGSVNSGFSYTNSAAAGDMALTISGSGSGYMAIFFATFK